MSSTRTTEVERLIATLSGDDAVARDAAIARLRVIGSRAVERLSQVVSSTATPATRAHALKALEAMDDRRALAAALAAQRATEPSVRLAAIPVLRWWLVRESGTEVLESLTAVALDRSQDAQLRLAALDALSDLPHHLVQPIFEEAGPAARDTPPLDDPSHLREWLAAHAEAPLSTLHDIIATVRQHERDEASARRRQDWLSARGVAHATLARRGSRVALYDLREAFDAATAPLPLDFLVAITTLGDAASLEPMARAWSSAPADAWWRSRVAEAAADIVRRLGLTRRHAALKRIADKWPGFLS